MTRFDRLTADQIATLNLETELRLKKVGIPVTHLTVEGACELAGIRDAKMLTIVALDEGGQAIEVEKTEDGFVLADTDTPHTGPTILADETDTDIGVVSGRTYAAQVVREPFHFSYRPNRKAPMGYYVLDRNRTNRPINLENCKALAETIVAKRYCLNGETMIVDDLGQGISLQHRCVAVKLASFTWPEVSVPVIIVPGIAHEIADTVDTGRSRTPADTAARQDDILPADTLRDKDGNAFADAVDIRRTLLRDRTSALRLSYLRVTGKDVSGAGKINAAKIFQMSDRFENFDALCTLVYNHDNKAKTGYAKLFGRPSIIAVLALASGIDHAPLAHWVDGPELLPQVDPVAMDLELAEGFLQMLANASADSGPLCSTSETVKTSLWTILCKGSGGKTALKREYKFGTLVNIFNAYVEYVTDGADMDSATEYFNPKLVPKAGSLSAQDYPLLGGVDCGSLKPVKESE